VGVKERVTPHRYQGKRKASRKSMELFSHHEPLSTVQLWWQQAPGTGTT